MRNREELPFDDRFARGEIEKEEFEERQILNAEVR
jgi:uncharacterized membrane protein